MKVQADWQIHVYVMLLAGSCVLFDLLMHQNDATDQTAESAVNNEQAQQTNGLGTPSPSNVGRIYECFYKSKKYK